MSIFVTSYDELDPELVQTAQQQQAQILQEWHPQLSVSRGVIHDLVLYPQGILLAALRLEMDRLRRSQSLLTAMQDPALADEELLEALAANFLMSRQEGAKARGRLTITVSKRVPLTVPQGLKFISQGLSFVSPVTYFVRTTEGAVEGPHDRWLRPVGNGTFTFQIQVEALETGLQYNVKRGTRFTPDPDLPYFASAEAADDFQGGRDWESNEELLQRLRYGPTVKTAAGRLHLVSAVTSRPEFSEAVHHSLIGFGDPEMHRDRHSLWPGSMGGRVDWYVQTREQVLSRELHVEAVLLHADLEQRGTWQFSLGRDDFPGFYLVERILAESEDQPCEIVEEIYGFDTSATPELDVLPDIQDATEAAYTRFQTRTVRFLDPYTSTQNLVPHESRRTYRIVLTGFPLLAELQAFVSSREFRAPGGDILIRAPLPCFVYVHVQLYRPYGSSAPDLDAASRACAGWVNRLGFRGRLTAAGLADVLQDVLGSQVEIASIDLRGMLLGPDGRRRYLHSSALLEIEPEEDFLISPRNTLFILREQDVQFSTEFRAAATL